MRYVHVQSDLNQASSHMPLNRCDSMNRDPTLVRAVHVYSLILTLTMHYITILITQCTFYINLIYIMCRKNKFKKNVFAANSSKQIGTAVHVHSSREKVMKLK